VAANRFLKKAAQRRPHPTFVISKSKLAISERLFPLGTPRIDKHYCHRDMNVCKKGLTSR